MTKKLDVTDLITELDDQKKVAAKADSDQETLKTALKKQTTATETALSTAYDSASTKLGHDHRQGGQDHRIWGATRPFAQQRPPGAE